MENRKICEEHLFFYNLIMDKKNKNRDRFKARMWDLEREANAEETACPAGGASCDCKKKSLGKRLNFSLDLWAQHALSLSVCGV